MLLDSIDFSNHKEARERLLSLMPLFYEECENCGGTEERVFVDSWTGLSLCSSCLWPIIGDVTSSPCSEGDNLEKLLETV